MVFYQDIDLYQGVDAGGDPDIDGFGTERPSTTPSRLAIPPSGFPLEQFETNDPSVRYPREDQPFVRAPDGTKENSSPEITSSLSTNRRARRCKPKQQWLLETLSIVISIASMTAVIIVLAKIEGTSLHNWNFFLQPNTVISTLIVISKTSLMSAAATCLSQLKWLYFWKSENHRRLKDLDIFDDASRGPLGAANFYARMRTFVPLGVLASFVMLLTLVMEPFSQQVLSFVTLPIASHGEIASIPISNAYNSTDYVSMAGSSSGLYDTMMQGAFYRGLFGMNGALDFQCPSSNCTWPDFSTLALCSTCQDITASTQIQEQDCDESNIISSAFIDTDQNFLNCTNYTFTTPGGGTLVGVVALENATGKYANGTWMTSVVSTLVVANNFGPGDRTTEDDWSLVTTIDVARFNWSETWSLDTARYMMATAFNTTQCSLTWCLKKYSGVSVVNGALNTFSTQDIPGQLLVPNNNSVDYVFTPNVSTLEIAPWMNASNFSVDINLAGGLLGYLVSGLSFNITTIPDPGWSLQSVVTPEIFLENTNTSGIIQDIAASMTDRIRHSGANVSALGSTLRPLTYIRVDWYWIILPIALVLLSAIVLVMTIWDNSRRGAPLWKSGLMPLLFHGPKGWRLDDLRVNSIKEMDRAARRMRTILIEDKPDDVRFVRR